MNKWVIHTATGEFRYGGFYDLTLPITGYGPPPHNKPIYDSDYSVVIISGELMPDLRTQKWSGSAVVAKSQAEIDAFDDQQIEQRAEQGANRDLEKTIIEFVLRQRLGRPPTAPERQAARAEFVGIYKVVASRGGG